jgi:signal transduction histidine kinase/ligand-binding sensor domain-containing protein
LLLILANVVPSADANLPSFPAGSGYLLHAWDTEKGLPENSASAIVQTPDGYLWFGTFMGLVRFDGVDFDVFAPVNTPPMPSAGIVNLHVDRMGRLWVSTYGGLVLREAGQWRQLHRQDGSPVDFVRAFSERANGDLLVTTFQGSIYEFSGGALVPLPPPPGESGQGYFGGADEEGHWWVVQNRFVGRWATNRWVSMISPPDLPRDAVGCAPSRDGGLWVLLGNELRKLRRGTEVARTLLPETPGGVWSLSEDSQGNVWIASYNQGFTRVTADGVLTRWRAADGASDNGRCVFEDREQNLWLGTSGDGLMRLTQRRFQHLELPSGPKRAPVNSVSADPHGGLWVATFGQGLFHLAEAGAVDLHPPTLTNGWLYLQSVLADRKGRLWVSKMGAEVWLKDQAGIRPVSSGEAEGLNVIALFEDSRGQVWMSTGGGRVSRMDGNTAQVFDAEDGLPRDAATCFAEDRDGGIWVASDSGVFRRPGEQPFREVKHPAGNAIRRVTCLQADRDGAMWLGSSDHGLLRWKNGTIAVLDAQLGFPVRAIDGIIEDGLGFFWMSAGRRLLRAHLRDLQAVAEGRLHRLTYQIFDASDGLAAAEFTGGRQPASTRGTHGRLWFATTKGVITVDPHALRLNTKVPPVYVREISFYHPGRAATHQTDGERSARNVQSAWREPFTSAVSLPPGSGRIEIRYTALSLTAPEKVRFQVKLEPVDAGWEDAQQSRAAYYYELSPGQYVFRVRAANNDGVYNEHGASLAFTVQPHYWQTGWFRLTGALLLIGLGGALVAGWSRRRVDLAVQRERAAHELQELREALAHSSRVSTMGQLASALAHEISQPLGAILRNAEAGELLIQQDPPDLAELRAILNDIRLDDKRAGGVIDRMRALLKRQKVEETQLSVRDLAQDIATLTRSDALRREVQLTLDLSPSLPPIRGDRVQLQQVLLNLVLNSMDAMGGQPPATRRLIVRARRTDAQMIEVRVQDSGPGIPAPSLPRLFEPFYTTKSMGLGLGLSISRTIIEAHGGRLEAENRPEGGACFWFTVPISEGNP